MVVGRGSFFEAFPLFGFRLEDYDSVFAEKLDLLLKIRDNEHVHWSGQFLGLPLMVAIIGGETSRFKPFTDLYREAGKQNGYLPDQLKIGVHSLGYVAETTNEAADDFFPGYRHAFNEIGKERGWAPVTRKDFDAQRGPNGALLIGDPDEVIEKIKHHSKILDGISRITFMMNPASLPHAKLMRAIELIGKHVAPALSKL